MDLSRFYRRFPLVALLVSLTSFLWAAAPKEQAVSLTTKDGWTLSAVYLPSVKGPTVVLLHDVGKDKQSFASFEKALAKAEFGYLAVDLRGHGQSATKADYRTFAKEGADNPFNQMLQDALSAVSFLRAKSVPDENIILLGTGLGANVAAKAAGVLPGIKAIALISPGVNIRDVLAVPALRSYKGAVLLAASADERKGFLEASILRNVAFLTAGEGNVTFLTAYDLNSHELLDKYLTPTVVQWVATPVRPELLPDAKPALTQRTQAPTGTLAIPPSSTEQALVPSVLME